jgi:hypothetical protein
MPPSTIATKLPPKKVRTLHRGIGICIEIDTNWSFWKSCGYNPLVGFYRSCFFLGLFSAAFFWQCFNGAPLMLDSYLDILLCGYLS